MPEKTVTIRGRLSYPVLTYQEALARNETSQYKKADLAKVSPSFNLLVEGPQLQKLVDHLRNIFLPYCVQQEAKGQTNDALDKKQAEKIDALLGAEDWDDQPPYIPIKSVPSKTMEMAPEAVASVKVLGPQGADIEQLAVVMNEVEMVNPDPDVLKYPILRPVGLTTHSIYAGCNAKATLNLYSFVSGKLPGISASAGAVVFFSDNDRFGGGVLVDEGAIFLDD